MKRRDAETPREDQISKKIIGAAIEVHRVLGPGLLESAYEECLCYEVELKTVESLLRVHYAQLLSHLRLSGKPVGLLINFNASTLKSGLKRVVNNFSEISAPRRLGVEESSDDAAAIS